jgi:hypothetical protein
LCCLTASTRRPKRRRWWVCFGGHGPPLFLHVPQPRRASAGCWAASLPRFMTTVVCFCTPCTPPRQLTRLANEHPGLLIQAFVPEVVAEGAGELSIIFFNLVFQFAVIKRPKAGDFRVQVWWWSLVGPPWGGGGGGAICRMGNCVGL